MKNGSQVKWLKRKSGGIKRDPAAKQESTKRELAVKQKRAMVRVRYLDDRRLATIAVCPACWNIPERRNVLLTKLKKMGLEAAFRDDRENGRYMTDKSHAPGCPYSRVSSDPWKRFSAVMKKR